MIGTDQKQVDTGCSTSGPPDPKSTEPNPDPLDEPVSDPVDEPKSTEPIAGAATADPAPANTVIALSATAATSVLDECIALLVR
ncbi:hypothetical protein GCM10020255_075060 [Rhodococcus baikonurensis]